MNYNLSDEDKKIVKGQFACWQELQGEKKSIAEAEKASKEKVAEVLDCKIGAAGKLFKLLQKKYDGSSEDEDIWTVIDSLFGGSEEEDSEETESEE